MDLIGSQNVALKDSSANYFVLSYLPWRQVLQMQAVSKKYYHSFVPTALNVR